MTIMPMAPMPAAVPVTADGSAVPADAAGSGLAGETFAALMAAQLGVPTDVPADPPAAAEPGTDTDDAATPTVATDAATPMVPAGLVLPATVTVPTGATPTTAGSDDTVEPLEPSFGTEQARGRSAEAPGHTETLPERAAAVGHEHRPGDPGVGDASAPVAPATPAIPAVPQSDAAQVPPTSPVTAATPAVPATPATPAPGASPAGPASNPVLDQVKPTFTRLVSGPEGTHRMMLRLHPADLGEIHLTVRVSGDAVDVTVAARPEARAMLVDGHSELRGLLDSVGRTATQITFRDLPGTGTAVQVVQNGGQHGSTNPDGQSAAQQGGYAAAGQGSGDSRGNGHSGAGAADQTSSSPRDGRPGVPAETRPTTTTPRTAGHGALDVRM